MAKDRNRIFRRFDVDVIDFLHSESVQVMDASEVGQYFLLLLHSWANEKEVTLPDDPACLARLARVPEVSVRVLVKFDKIDTDAGPRLRNAALYEEWLRVQKRAEEGRVNVGKRKDRNSTLAENGKVATTQSQSHTKDQNITSNSFDLLPTETSTGGNEVKFASPSPIKEVWSYYLHQTGKNAALYTLTPKRHQMGLRRFTESLKKVKGDSAKAVVLMKCAIDAMVASDFHQGKNDSKKKYLDWELLFRSTEKFEQWLERADQ